MSWTLLQADTIMVYRDPGSPGCCEKSWWKCCVKNRPGWEPSSWNAVHLRQTEAIYAGSIYWLVQALLNYTSTAPWLLETLQKLSKSQFLVQRKAWTCHLERGTGKKEDVSGCSFSQRPWVWHSSGSSVPSPGQERWTGQAPLWLERYLHRSQK